MLEITFASPDAIASAFRTALTFPAVLSAAVAVILLAPTMRAKVGLRIAIATPACVFAVLFSLCYWLTYTDFVQATVTPSAITMHYPGPFGGPVVATREDIAQVLFGLPGKSMHACTLAIVTKSGMRYHSAIAARRDSECKRMRSDILGTLKLTK